MNKSRLLTLILVVLIYSCRNENSNIEKHKHYQAVFNHYISLKENKTIIGNISSYVILDNGGLIVADTKSSKIVIYDKRGNQIKVIHAEGSGPLEFQNPSLVKYYNEKIYVWCNQQLKIITYNLDGYPIEEFKFFDRAISNFTPYKNKIIMYTKGGYFDSYIHIYDLNKKILEASLKQVSNEQILLDILSCSGGLEVKNNTLIFMNSSELNIHRYDLQEMKSIKSTLLTDNEFNVEKIKNDPVDLVNSDFDRVNEYIHKNSVMTGFYTVGDGYVVISEVGEYNGNADHDELDSSKRYNKYYILDKNFKIQKIYKSKVKNACLFESSRNKLYHMEIIQSESGEQYVVNEFSP